MLDDESFFGASQWAPRVFFVVGVLAEVAVRATAGRGRRGREAACLPASPG